MILVTGGAGLVGSHLLRSLVGDNKAVRAIYRGGGSGFVDVLDVVDLMRLWRLAVWRRRQCWSNELR